MEVYRVNRFNRYLSLFLYLFLGAQIIPSFAMQESENDSDNSAEVVEVGGGAGSTVAAEGAVAKKKKKKKKKKKAAQDASGGQAGGAAAAAQAEPMPTVDLRAALGFTGKKTELEGYLKKLQKLAHLLLLQYN